MAKVVAGLCSIPSRVNQLRRTVKSLLHQVDQLNVCLNGYDSIPNYLNHQKIKVFKSDGTMGDANKFISVEGEIYLSCDDDIIYPNNYVVQCKRNLKTYPGKIITYHGRTIRRYPVASYYRAPKIMHHCRYEQKYDALVQFGGTGVMAFNTETFKPSVDQFDHPNMADIIVATLAKKQGIKIMCCKHREGWFKVQQVPDTIYAKHSKRDEVQTKYVNEVWLKA